MPEAREGTAWGLLATACGLAALAALAAALILPISGWLVVPLALAAGAAGWAVGFVAYLVVSAPLDNRRMRRRMERGYEETTGRPFPGWPKKSKGPEPPDAAPVGR